MNTPVAVLFNLTNCFNSLCLEAYTHHHHNILTIIKKKKTKSTGSKDDKKTKLLKLGQKLSRAISKLEKDEINANACFLGKKRRLAEGREKLGKAEEDQKK